MDDKPIRGPVIGPALCEWLDFGGPFPPTLNVKLAGPEGHSHSVSYQILDRDANGKIEALRHRRRGKKGFVLRVRETATGQQLAAKLCIPADYADGHSPLMEADYASKLRGLEEVFQLPHGVGRVEVFDGQPTAEETRPWVCFLTDWLTGHTLQEMLDEHCEQVTPGLVVQVGEALLTAVLILERRGLKHDDLHLGNVMLFETDADRLAIDTSLPRHRLKIIDLGSLKALERPTFKSEDDWSMVAKGLSELHNALFKNRAIASRYPHFLHQMRGFIEALAEQDLCRHFPDQGSYLIRFREVANALNVLPRIQSTFHPFEAISAEHLASDRLLLQLFVSHLPWITLVQSTEPSVLIGPRGCGKSMVFRYLSLRTHLTATTASFETVRQLGLFGIYIGCASDVGNDLLWIAREEGRPERLAGSITTYFNLVLMRELLRTLAASTRAEEISATLGLTPYARTSIAEFIEGQLGEALGLIRLPGMDPLQTCADLVELLRLRLSREMLENKPPTLQLPTTFLRDLCQKIIDVAPGFGEWRITFLLDDYTIHRLSRPIQSVLNTVLWQRTSTHVFKISSEPNGFDASHVDGARIDAHREYVPIDSGDLSIGQEEPKERREFITTLLNKRLQAGGFRGTAESLIGDSTQRSDAALAKYIRSVKGERIGAKSYYHGLQILSNAWSGDVATVLHMVREMFVRAGVGPETSTKISEKIQHESITKVSTALRERVLGYHPFGQEMGRVLAAVGDLARRLLVDAPDNVDRKQRTVVHRRYRFEMTLPAGIELESELSKLPNGQRIIGVMHELVRRAIFVQLSPSRGKEGGARRTLRWQVRASFLPSFGTSLVRRHYIDIKRIEDFVELLTMPDDFANKVYARYAKSPSTSDLFHDLDVDVEDEEEDDSE